MKVSFQVLGSLGDVLPYVSVAQTLKRRGYDVSVLAPGDFSALIRSKGITPAEPPAFSFESWMLEAAHRGTLLSPYALFRDWKRMVVPHIDDVTAKCVAAADGASIVVSNIVCAPARVAAEAYRIPFMLVGQQSLLSPTASEPCAMVWRSWQGRRFNRLGYSLVNLCNRIVGLSLRRHRRTLGVVQKPAAGNLRSHLGRPLIKVSTVPWPVMRQTPQDWGACDYLTAYPSLESASTERLSADVDAFLNRGTPPVYIGLGSLSASHGNRLLEAAVSAVQSAGLRALVSSRLCPEIVLPESQFMRVGHEPHDRLFPRCALVFHHGGAGTVDTAIRAGAPQLIQPHFMDQYWYASRLEALGVAPGPVDRAGTTSKDIARRIDTALSRCALTAESLKQRAINQSGTDTVADIIVAEADGKMSAPPATG